MTTKGYLILTMKTIVVMTIVELLIYFLVSNSEPRRAITWHYYAIFTNVMIAGGVFFRERCMWEIRNGYTQSHSETTTLANYLLHTSWIIVLLFLLTSCLSFTDLPGMIIPDKFLHLCRWPALISGVIQILLTMGSSFALESEIVDGYKSSYNNADD